MKIVNKKIVILIVLVLSILLVVNYTNANNDEKKQDEGINLSQVKIDNEKIYSAGYPSDLMIEDLKIRWFSEQSTFGGTLIGARFSTSRWVRINTTYKVIKYYYIADNVGQVTNLKQLKILENSTPPTGPRIDMFKADYEPKLKGDSNLTVLENHEKMEFQFYVKREGGFIIETQNGTFMMSLVNGTYNVANMSIRYLS